MEDSKDEVSGKLPHEGGVSRKRNNGDDDREDDVTDPPPSRPRTRNALKEQKEKEAEKDKTKSGLDIGQNSHMIRRSPRDTNKISLKGTAPTFYRRLRTLFFSPTSHKGFQEIGGSKIKLKRVYRNPPVYVIDNFLTPSDLEYFDDKIASLRFQKSYVDNMQKEEDEKGTDNKGGTTTNARSTLYDNSHRTSTFFGFKKLHDTRIAALEQRIADLLGCWVHQIEALQLVRYLPTQFFGIHHDLGDLLDTDEVTLPPKNQFAKRRLVTLFCYLNTLDKKSGGCTYFPKCGDLRVKPVKGRAVLWSNIMGTGMPDPRTIHAGEAVQGADTVKYGLNVWICEE